MAIPVILDTDTAQDDCVALLLAALDPACDLRAITMVAGNIDFDQQVHNAFMTLSVAGRLGEIPVHLGCRRPIMRPWVSAENVHGDGVGGLRMDLAGCAVEDEHGVDTLLRLTAEAPGEITVVAIGPLTNIAMAVIKDPSFVTNVGRLVIMGGSNNARGNITPAAEFNFYVDPEAARVVFEAGFADIVVIPWAPLTVRDAVFSRDQIAQIEALGTPLAHFFTRVVADTLEFDEAVGIPGSTHPDSLALALQLHPELQLEAAPHHVAIETESEKHRGYASMSWGVHDLNPNALVVEKIDAQGFYRLLTDLCRAEIALPRPIEGLNATLDLHRGPGAGAH